MRRYVALVFMTFLGSSSILSAETVTLETLLREMADRSIPTRQPEPKYTAKGASSYDRASKVNNPADGLYVEKKGRDWGKGWFGNRDFGQFIRTETNNGRKENVLMEDTGPGVVVRWWATANNNGTIRIYLDGSDEPTIEMKPAELVGGHGLAPYPFSLRASDDTTNPNWRGHDLYLPIPYKEGCKSRGRVAVLTTRSATEGTLPARTSRPSPWTSSSRPRTS